jgi:hypothetical protein
VSAIYLRQIEAVESEYRTAQAAVRFVLANWHKEDVIRGFVDQLGGSRQDLENAAANFEATYFVRLFARFEGILESHLTTNHPLTVMPRDRKVDWLVGTVDRRERIRLGPNWRRRFEQVRQTRNDIAHGRNQLAVTFDEGKAILSKFVNRMPNPRD